VQDTHVLGTFIENHDLPRFANTTVDPQLQMTALAFQFVTDGIPIVYYGQEQQFHGIADPVRPLFSSLLPILPSSRSFSR
jgi:alpha-amylase